MAKADIIERERAYYTGTQHETIPAGELVTVMRKGRSKSIVRARGFEHEVRTKDLDFGVESESAKLRFEPPN